MDTSKVNAENRCKIIPFISRKERVLDMIIGFTQNLYNQIELQNHECSHRPEIMQRMSDDFIMQEITPANHIPQLIRILWDTFPGLDLNFLLNICDTAIHEQAVPKKKIWNIWEEFFINYFSEPENEKLIRSSVQPAEYILEGVIKTILEPGNTLQLNLQMLACGQNC